MKHVEVCWVVLLAGSLLFIAQTVAQPAPPPARSAATPKSPPPAVVATRPTWKELTAAQRRFVLLTCHTPALGPSRLKRVLAGSLAAGDERSVRVQPLFLPTADGRQLPSGLAATWTE